MAVPGNLVNINTSSSSSSPPASLPDNNNTPTDAPAKHSTGAAGIRVPYKELSIGAELGRGAYGVVFSGSYYGSPVAIKKLFLNVPNNLVADFHKEVSVMRRLRHPNVVLFIGACMEPDPLCIVTELGHNGSLESVMERRSLTWAERLKFSLDIARGMNYLHHASVIHMDLKPSNVIVTNQDVCKVGDFGLSKILNYESMSVTNKGGPGTVAYTAPEVFRGDRISTKVDVYSFGMCCWQLLTAKRPYEGMHQHAVCFNVVAQHQRPAFPKELGVETTCSSLSESRKKAAIRTDGDEESILEQHKNFYVALIQLCWHRNHKQRPSFDDIIELLERASKAEYHGVGNSAMCMMPRHAQKKGIEGYCAGDAMEHHSVENTDPREWTVDEVEQWLDMNEMDMDVIDIFVDNDINGKVLLSLTDDDLKTALGILSFGKRRQIQLLISKLCEELVDFLEQSDDNDDAEGAHGSDGDLKGGKGPVLVALQPGILRIDEAGECFIRSNGHEFKSGQLGQVSSCRVCEIPFGGLKAFKCIDCGMTIHRECSRVPWPCEESVANTGHLVKTSSASNLTTFEEKKEALESNPDGYIDDTPRKMASKSKSASRLSDLILSSEPSASDKNIKALGVNHPHNSISPRSPSSPSSISRFFGKISFKKKGRSSSNEIFAASTSGLGRKSKSSKKKTKGKGGSKSSGQTSVVVNEDMQEVIGRILVAISKGVPLYTSGQHQRCFEVYRGSAELIVSVYKSKKAKDSKLGPGQMHQGHGKDRSTPPSSPGITPSSLSPASAFSRDPSTRYEDVIRHLKAALRATDDDDCSSYREKAWILRRAFDFVLHAEGVISMAQTEEMFNFTDVQVGRNLDDNGDDDDLFDEEYVAIEPTE
eukprot:Nk52_evm14s260 gene=Nk52_evmTU14s260